MQNLTSVKSNWQILKRRGNKKKIVKYISSESQFLCLNKCFMKYLFIVPSLSIKYNFHRWKLVDPPLGASEVHQMLSWWRHIDRA